MSSPNRLARRKARRRALESQRQNAVRAIIVEIGSEIRGVPQGVVSEEIKKTRDKARRYARDKKIANRVAHFILSHKKNPDDLSDEEIMRIASDLMRDWWCEREDRRPVKHG